MGKASEDVMTNIRTRLWTAFLGAVLALAALGPAPAQAAQRIEVTGEVIDSWCYLTEIMYPEGTAHHQCALWCAAGGIPVGILGDDGTVYMVLKTGDDTTSVANPAVLEIQSHRVKVDGALYKRDGINYLVVDRVLADEGIVKVNHEEWGVQPFGK
jgi:hypothetical protein